MDAPTTRWRPPLIWRALMLLARLATSLVCRLRVTGEVAPALRQGPLVVASNHIGVFDPVALVAACQARGVAPRMMATGGLFRTPIIGWLLRRCGHIRVDRRLPTVGHALPAATQALLDGSWWRRIRRAASRWIRASGRSAARRAWPGWL